MNAFGYALFCVLSGTCFYSRSPCLCSSEAFQIRKTQICVPLTAHHITNGAKYFKIVLKCCLPYFPSVFSKSPANVVLKAGTSLVCSITYRDDGTGCWRKQFMVYMQELKVRKNLCIYQSPKKYHWVAAS